jgi:hypothetical protein
MRKLAFLWIAVAILVVMSGFSDVGVSKELECCLPPTGGVVDKMPGGAFTVEIGFKNIGTTEGTWAVNVACEGETWTWTGIAQTMTLKYGAKKTLTWNGSVPVNAPIDAIARLVVYYGNSAKPLEWWIHVVPAAELSITYSIVR